MLRHQQTSRTGPFFRDHPKNHPSDLKWLEPLEVSYGPMALPNRHFPRIFHRVIGGVPLGAEKQVSKCLPVLLSSRLWISPRMTCCDVRNAAPYLETKCNLVRIDPIDNSCSSMILGYTWASYLAGQLFLKSAETRSPTIWPKLHQQLAPPHRSEDCESPRSAVLRRKKSIEGSDFALLGKLFITETEVGSINGGAPKICTFISWYCKSYENGWSGGASILGDLHINAP